MQHFSPSPNEIVLLSEVFGKYELTTRYTFDPEELDYDKCTALMDEILTMPNLTYDTRTQVNSLLSALHLQQEKQRKQSWALREAEVSHAHLEFKVARLESENDDLSEKAYKDALTGIFNRLYFVQALEAELEKFNASNKGRRRTDGAAVVFIDLRKFKPINDTYGHDAGDQALCEVANILSDDEIIRSDDVVARWGGDEFVVLIKNIKHPDSQKVFARLQDALDEIKFKYKKDGKTTEITFSARLGKIDIEPNKKPDQIMHEADMVMINSKDPRDRQGPVTAIDATLSGPSVN